MFNLDIILIDLTLDNDFERIVEDNNLSGVIAPEALSSFKEDGYLKIWVDPKSVEVIAYTSQGKKGITINSGFISYLKDIKPLTVTSELVSEEITLSTDMILDKINKTGMKSLTKEELKYLKNSK